MPPPTEAPTRDEGPAAPRRRRPGAARAPVPPALGDAPTVADERRSPWQQVGRLAIVVMIVGITVMWLYAFFGDVPSPARLDDRTFPEAAEPICARARAEIDLLPRAFESPDAASRADVVDRATTTLTGMVADLRAAVPPTEPTRARLNRWLDDWDVYLHDRRDYTSRLRADRTARFYETRSERDNNRVSSSLDHFARVNTMASCATPEDVV